MGKPDSGVFLRSVNLDDTSRPAAVAMAMRRWKLVIGCGLVGAASAAALCQILPIRYASSVTLMLNPISQQRGSTDTGPSSLMPPSEEMVRKNEMALVRSRQLAEQVVQDLNLQNDPEFNLTLAPPSAMKIAVQHMQTFLGKLLAALGQPRVPATEVTPASQRALTVDTLLSRLDVTATDASRIVEIRFSATTPAKAAQIAQTIAEHARDWSAGSLTASAKASTQSLDAAIATLNLKIRDAERHIEAILQEHGGLPAANLSVLAQNIANLSTQIGNAAGERAASEARLAQLRAARASNQVDALPAVLGSLLIQRLQAQAAELTAKAAGQAAMYDGRSGKAIEVRAELNALHAQIDQEVNRIAASYESDVAGARSKEATLSRMLEVLKTQLAESRAAAVDVKMYEREVEIHRTVLARLVTQLAAQTGQIDSDPRGGEIISNATIPRSVSFPPRMPLIAAGFMLFATAGSGLAVLLERRNNGIRSMAQLRDLTTAKVLGAIPRTGKSLLLSRPAPAGLVLSEPTSRFADSLRALWLRLQYAGPDPVRLVLITSAVAGEGKSAMTASLARMLAASGRSIVLVDADLRAPKVDSMLGLQLSPGLANLLEGDADLEEVLQRDRVSSAFVIPAGTTQRSPVELLSSPAMTRLLHDLSARFSFVLIDSPPVLAVPDTGILARLADTIVLAVRWGSTSSPTFSAAMQHLEDLDVNVHGLVLTMVDPKEYSENGYIGGGLYSGARNSYYAQ